MMSESAEIYGDCVAAGLRACRVRVNIGNSRQGHLLLRD